MSNNFFRQCILIGFVALISTSCSYIQLYRQQAQYSQIQNEITFSTLDKVHKYTSRSPFNKTYEFEFINSQAKPYALIFYLSENSFSKSIIKHRNAKDLHREAIRIDDSKNILTALNRNLPNAKSISWQHVSNYIAEDEARDSYYVLQEYIRFKIRDL
jgi:hypothetical protein